MAMTSSERYRKWKKLNPARAKELKRVWAKKTRAAGKDAEYNKRLARKRAHSQWRKEKGYFYSHTY